MSPIASIICIFKFCENVGVPAWVVIVTVICPFVDPILSIVKSSKAKDSNKDLSNMIEKWNKSC